MAEEKPPLAEIANELFGAYARYNEAKLRENVARNETTAALNDVNRLQKKLDECVTEIRANAPRDSDWGRGQ